MNNDVTEFIQAAKGKADRLYSELDRLATETTEDVDRVRQAWDCFLAFQSDAASDLCSAALAVKNGNGGSEPEMEVVSRDDLLGLLSTSVGDIDVPEDLVRAANNAQNNFWVYWNGENFSTRPRTEVEKATAAAEQRGGSISVTAPTPDPEAVCS